MEPPPSQSSADETQRYCERIEKRAGAKPRWGLLWPIALAPSIPLLGMALKDKPHIRNPVVAGWSGAILLWATSTSILGPPTGNDSGWK